MAKLSTGIGFHMTGNNEADGIGEYWKALAAAGHAVVTKGFNAGGPAFEAQLLKQKYPNQQIDGIWRFGKFYGDSDVPNYNAEPQQEAAFYWGEIDTVFPKELNKDFVWVEFPNEIDKGRNTWVAEFVYECGMIALAKGYKYLAPGWSAGEPEPEHWNRWPDYLQLCHEHPTQLGISLHEYSFKKLPKLLDHPYLVGRVGFLNKAARSMGFNPPTVFITEFGYTYNDAPPANIGVPDVIETVEWYIRNAPNVQGVLLWCLDQDKKWRDLPKIMNSYIDPMKDTILNTGFPEKQQTTTPPIQGKHKIVVMKPAQEHNKEQYLEICEKSAEEYYRDITRSADTLLRILSDPKANNESHAIIWDAQFPSQQETIKMLENNNINYIRRQLIEDLAPGFEGLEFGFVFNQPYTMTSKFGDPRDYSHLPGGIKDDKHEGADYDVYDAAANSKAPVLALYQGIVDKAGHSPGYGKYVVVASHYKGVSFQIYYAHLDEIYVNADQGIGKGHKVGEIGDSGNAKGEHVHITMKSETWGKDGYIIEKVLDPDQFCPHPHQEMVPITPQGRKFNIAEYMIGTSGQVHKIVTTEGPHKGAVEYIKYDDLGDNKFALVKNSQFELLRVTDKYIERGLDTSPGNGRFYVQFVPGNSADTAPWIGKFMEEGELFTADEVHRVQFYEKDGCTESVPNSGWARNVTRFHKHHAELFGLPDVIEIQTNTGELMFYAKGKGFVGWISPWGASQYDGIENVQMKRESGCFDIFI